MDPSQKNPRRQIKGDSGMRGGTKTGECRREKDKCRWRQGTSLSRRTHIKYQPEDYHRPALPHAGFPASAFCRGSFYREYMHQPALCYFLPFFCQSSPFSSCAPGVTNPTTLFPPTLNPSPFPSDSTYPCTVQFYFRSRAAVPVTYV